MFSTEFCGLWVKIKNMIFCPKMYRLSEIFRGGVSKQQLLNL